jgi:hypothetical protein
MARVTSSPAAQQPKVTSHSAQASTSLVRGPNATLLSTRPDGPAQSAGLPVRDRHGGARPALGLSQVPVTLGQRRNRFP